MKTSAVLGLAALFGASQALILPPVSDGFLDESPLIKTPEWYETPFLEEAWTPTVAEVWTQMIEKYGAARAEAMMRERNPSPQTKKSTVFSKPAKRAGHDYVEHDAFPSYTLRARDAKSDLLNMDTGNYTTGYFDLHEEDKHLFYWFFPSRNDPKKDPVILWLNGGPGCSSATGMLYELGPSNLINGTLVHNPYSWNNNASVIFLDQPVGVGYSYYLGSDVDTTAIAAPDFYAFVELFFKKFPEYLKNEFHIAGESFAGHYVPAYAAEVMAHPERSFNLTSIMVGNGFFSGRIQYPANPPMVCGQGGQAAILTPGECVLMQKSVKKCAKLATQCETTYDTNVCFIATVFCGEKLDAPVQASHYDIYDIRQKCGEDACQAGFNQISVFLNSTDVKTALGVDPNFNYEGCNDTTNIQFTKAGDRMSSSVPYLTLLLNDGIPVLLYAGDKDFVCNWLGVKAVALLTSFDRQAEFGSLKNALWITKDKQKAGEVMSGGNLTFLRVYNAGHMVPHDQPSNSLDMVNRWIAGDRSFLN